MDDVAHIAFGMIALNTLPDGVILTVVIAFYYRGRRWNVQRQQK